MNDLSRCFLLDYNGRNSVWIYDYPYHSLNPAQAIERILEGSGSNEDDYTEKGVQILRGILEREKKRTIHNRTADPNERSGRRFYVGAKSDKLVIRQVIRQNKLDV